VCGGERGEAESDQRRADRPGEARHSFFPFLKTSPSPARVCCMHVLAARAHHWAPERTAIESVQTAKNHPLTLPHSATGGARYAGTIYVAFSARAVNAVISPARAAELRAEWEMT
jgi:hypothetical protein